MRQTKNKYNFHKVALCLIAAFFTLSIMPIPKASAAENYFYASGSTITLIGAIAAVSFLLKKQINNLRK